jgi:hypothetical protein
MGMHAGGDPCRTFRTRDDPRRHTRRGVDCHNIAAAGSGDKSRSAGARANIDQAITGTQVEVIERAAGEHIGERLENRLVHCNVIVPTFGILVRL